MQKNYNLPCTGVYKPPGGVQANMAFSVGSKTQAHGREPSQKASCSTSPSTQGDITGAQPFKVCKVFLLVCLYGQQSPTHAGAGTVRAGCSRSGDQDASAGGEAPGMCYQDQGSQPWAGCSPPSRRGPKRCPTILMDPGRLPEGGGVESHLGIPSSPPIPCLRREGNLHFEREEEERPIRSPLSARASSLATCSHIG